MSEQEFAEKVRDAVCPICATRYQASRKRPAPTCGNPNCIRTARAQGFPFVGKPPCREKKPKKPKKPKDKKPKKPK